MQSKRLCQSISFLGRFWRVSTLGLALLMAGCGSDSNTGSLGRAVQPLAVGAQASDLPLVGAWSTSPYGPYPLGPLTQDALPTPGSPEVALFPNNQAENRSFRMLIRPTLGGKALRVHLSNRMGTQAIRFENISVAKGKPLTPNIDSARQVKLTVNNQNFGVAAPGGELYTDVLPFEFNAGEDLAVTFHVSGQSGPMTWHAVSFGPQYVSPHNSGDVTTDNVGLSFREVATGWFFLSGLEVINPKATGAVVALGDSITDGFLQVLNQRWTDRLANRLQAQGLQVGVLNQGINSNTVTPARNGFAGPPAVQRFDLDVLAQQGVKGLLLFEGTNDIGAGVKAESLIDAYKGLIARAREKGLCVFMGTIPPRADVAFGWFPDGLTVKEPERQKVNAWIRSTPLIDGVMDFDRVLGLPGAPTLPNPVLYIPDLLHPNSLGFASMGDSIDLVALKQRCGL